MEPYAPASGTARVVRGRNLPRSMIAMSHFARLPAHLCLFYLGCCEPRTRDTMTREGGVVAYERRPTPMDGGAARLTFCAVAARSAILARRERRPSHVPSSYTVKKVESILIESRSDGMITQRYHLIFSYHDTYYVLYHPIRGIRWYLIGVIPSERDKLHSIFWF